MCSAVLYHIIHWVANITIRENNRQSPKLPRVQGRCEVRAGGWLFKQGSIRIGAALCRISTWVDNDREQMVSKNAEVA